MGKTVTIYDIAREAGVSAATVSRVLTGKAKVSEGKREKIERLIREYDYKPNALARSLRETKSRVIGMVLGSILLLVQPAEEINAADWLGSCIGYIFAAWICVSIMLPIRLKFDSEKSRYANLIMIAVVFIAAFLVSSAIDYLPVSIVEAGKEWFYGLSAGGVLGIAGGITVAAVIISYLCSQHIMAKKEF